MRHLLKTEVGIEDLAADELRERCPQVRVDPGNLPGRILVETDRAEPLFEMTTVDHVIEIRGEARATTLDEVRRVVAGFEFPELALCKSFRVTSECHGDHPFKREQLQGAAGAVIQQRYGTPVDLTGFEVNVRVDLYDDRLVAGVQRTRRSLAKRIKRTRSLRTSIKPTIAAAMVRMAGAHRGTGRLIDPMCGTGNIPIEAKRINPRLAVHASDWDQGTVEVARGTIANHDLDVELRVCDARSLAASFPEPFDYIVTDPPYGVRLGRRSGTAALYRALVPSLERCLAANGRIVVAVLKLGAFLRELERSELRVLAERQVGSGDLRPRLLLLERSGASLKR